MRKIGTWHGMAPQGGVLIPANLILNPTLPPYNGGYRIPDVVPVRSATITPVKLEPLQDGEVVGYAVETFGDTDAHNSKGTVYAFSPVEISIIIRTESERLVDAVGNPKSVAKEAGKKAYLEGLRGKELDKVVEQAYSQSLKVTRAAAKAILMEEAGLVVEKKA